MVAPFIFVAILLGAVVFGFVAAILLIKAGFTLFGWGLLVALVIFCLVLAEQAENP